jgi:hypothetical protein
VAPNDDKPDLKVKDLLTPETQAELERWFGLPSYQELEEKGIQVEDAESIAAREQYDRAIAAVDPALLAAIEQLTYPPEKLLRFNATITPSATAKTVLFDEGMIDRVYQHAEPREVLIPDELLRDLDNCTPQALLRDLHRAELDFEKFFEMVELPEELRVNGPAVVAETMATRWRPELAHPLHAARAEITAAHLDRRQPWAAMCSAEPLPNRRWVTE